MKKEVKNLSCRCSTQNTRFACPGSDFCGQRCVRMRADLWDGDQYAPLEKLGELPTPDLTQEEKEFLSKSTLETLRDC